MSVALVRAAKKNACWKGASIDRRSFGRRPRAAGLCSFHLTGNSLVGQCAERVKAMCEWLSEYEAVIAMNRANVMGAGEVPDIVQFVDPAATVATANRILAATE